MSANVRITRGAVMLGVVVVAAAAVTLSGAARSQGRGRGGAPLQTRILLIADRPSHGPGEHEHNAAVWLLQKALTRMPGVAATPSFGRWPADENLIDEADAIVMVCDGGDRHPAFQDDHAAALQRAADRGAGLMFVHYCVEPPAESGHAEMLDWIGGYFEINYSVNPHWDASFTTIPEHPITRGVEPFTLRDEWYYNLRFRPEMAGVTPLLTAIPTPDTLDRPDGTHSGNPTVRARAGQPMVVAWAAERPDGGRGFGTSGGHFHANYGNPSFRTLILNAVRWVAKLEVPPEGTGYDLQPGELDERLDPKRGRGGGA